MYKVQVFYDQDCAEAAARIAAYRMGISKKFVLSTWEDRKYYCKGVNGVPKMILQAVEMADLDMESGEFTEEDLYEIREAEDYYDADEFWFPLGWDTADIAMIQMSNIFELSDCEGYLKTYFYC